MCAKSVVLMGLIATIVTCQEKAQLGMRITGGQYTNISNFPWQLSLQENFRHVCGASVLSANRALTAAHCFVGPEDDPIYTVVAGLESHTQDNIDNHIEVSKVIQHPHYKSITKDIAVLWLARDLIIDYVKIRPVRLPEHNSPVRHGMTVFVSGWGRTSNAENVGIPRKLKWTPLKVISNKRCNILCENRIDSNMICAGWSKGRRGFREGDSGGALVTAGEHAEQIGIVSWWLKDDAEEFPGVYTRVSAYVKWIKNVS